MGYRLLLLIRLCFGSGSLVNDVPQAWFDSAHHDRHPERIQRATAHHLQYATTQGRKTAGTTDEVWQPIFPPAFCAPVQAHG